MRKKKSIKIIEEEEFIDQWCKDCIHADMKRHKCSKCDIILTQRSHYNCSSYEIEGE